MGLVLGLLLPGLSLASPPSAAASSVPPPPGKAPFPVSRGDPGPTSGKAGPGSEPGTPPVARDWPVTGGRGARPRVVRGWQPPATRWSRGHRGVDLAAPAGASVQAVLPGRVTFSGVVAGRGVVSVELDRSGEPPLRTTFEPVTPLLHQGDRVAAGRSVGRLGPGPFHCETPCLHWGLRRGREYLDPLSLLAPGLLRRAPSRLLPVTGIPLPGSREKAPPVASTHVALPFGRSVAYGRRASEGPVPVVTGAVLVLVCCLAHRRSQPRAPGSPKQGHCERHSPRRRTRGRAGLPATVQSLHSRSLGPPWPGRVRRRGAGPELAGAVGSSQRGKGSETT
ncbi:murein hydrolase activator EnvC family protein [Streptomyces sp. NPDC059740]|uniref:murein hydrolase activator EnvC family protein n=1 Tax=Streptomyces sp. NPDC059740 TaxID=3346926 RepID=UPI00366598B9